MSVGLIALLDDVAAIAKVAAASLDDVAGQAAKAGAKAAGVVIDDTAVTPHYVTGFAAARELPIIGKIALGSLKNKLVFLLPIALVLSVALPHAIVPLLMIGGLYLCYEGAEKIWELAFPHAAHEHEHAVVGAPLDARALEDQKVAGAIRTDFILSAEIMTITLGALPAAGVASQAVILALVGTGITVLVYGVVALIVKADDVGLHLSQMSGGPASALLRPLGRALVQSMPYFLGALGFIGTLAMVWVGGGIVLHGFEEYGYGRLSHVLEEAGDWAAGVVPAVGGFVSWFVRALGAAFVGLVAGALAIPLMGRLVIPAWRAFRARAGRPRTT